MLTPERSYPDAIKEHVHVTKVYIPEDVAKALKANPLLVQRAVETFYTRDAIQLRVSFMEIFPLSNAKNPSEYQGCTSNVSFPASYSGAQQYQDDQDRLCTISRSKVLFA